MKLALLACLRSADAVEIAAVLSKTHTVDMVTDRGSCLDQFRATRYDVTFLDLAALHPNVSDQPVDYAKALGPFWELYPAAEIIIVAGDRSVGEAVRAVRAGASGYLTSPIHPAEVRYALESLSENAQAAAELDYLREQFWTGDALELVRTQSPLMREAVCQMQLVAPTRTTVLLTGETGTGKGALAKVIHQHSNRKDAPFVAVHCGAIPDTLVESELFGHEKAAFTGATQRRLGRFETAHGGTIFLDEIGTLSPSAQIKLLQVLQEHVLQRVGSDVPVEVDVRVIAATNADLKQLCETDRFRRDLLYRLNVFPVHVPSLRERHEDIPTLAETFRKRFCRLTGKTIRTISPAVLAALATYSWPGNVREMENLFERAFILERSSSLTVESFPSEIMAAARLALPTRAPLDTEQTLEQVQRSALEILKREYVKAQLTKHKGRIDRTAMAAGITTRHLNKLMRKYGLRKEQFK